MAESIGALRAEMSAGHAQFTQDMGKARRSVETNATGMQRAMDRVRHGFDSALSSVKLMGIAAAATAAGGMVAFIKSAINTADEMGEMAQAIGVPVESLSTLAYAAKMSGSDIEGLRVALGRFSRNLSDTVKGTGEAKDAFKVMNIDIKESNGSIRSTEDLLKEIADRFKGMEDGATKTALAMQLFGKSGAELIPMLNRGSAEISQLQQRARELGLEIDTETSEAAGRFNDELDDLQFAAKGLGMDIAQILVPRLTELVVKIREANKEGGALAAVWAAIKGTGSALVEPDADKQLERARELLERAKKMTPNDSAFLGHKFSQKAIDQTIADAQRYVDMLEAQKKAETETFNARKEQKAAEDQMRADVTASTEKHMAVLRERETAEKKAATDAANRQKALAKEEEDAHNLRVDTYLKDEADKWEKLEEWEKEYAEKQVEFADAHQKATLSTVGYELKQLQEKYDAYAVYIDDKIKLDEWYEGEKAKILETSVEAEKGMIEELKQAIEGWGKDSSAAIVDFAMTGKQSFSEMVQSMIADLLKMMVYQQIMQPLFGAVSSGVSGYFNSGVAPIGSVTGRATGGPVSAGKMYEVNERGVPELLNVGNRQFLMMADQGGHVTAAGSGSSGGGYGGGGGEVTVNIINKNGSEVSTQQKDTPQGIEIDVMIDQAVSKKLGQFGSKSNKTLKSTYGARERLVSR